MDVIDHKEAAYWKDKWKAAINEVTVLRDQLANVSIELKEVRDRKIQLEGLIGKAAIKAAKLYRKNGKKSSYQTR